MLDDLAGKRTGERIQILRERKGLSRPVLAGLVGMSAGWLKGIEQGRRLPPRLPADRRSASAVLSDVYALAWTLGMVQRSAGDIDGALSLARDATALLEPLMDDGSDDVPALAGALELHAATTCARAGREGDAWRYWDRASTIARRLPDGYHHPWTMFGASNVELHAVSISADLSKSQEARSRAEQIDPEEIPSRERRGRLGVEIARSYGQRQDYPGMLHWLEFAYQTSTDSVRYSPSARQMASEAVDHGGPLIRNRARTLAGSLGLPL